MKETEKSVLKEWIMIYCDGKVMWDMPREDYFKNNKYLDSIVLEGVVVIRFYTR